MFIPFFLKSDLSLAEYQFVNVLFLGSTPFAPLNKQMRYEKGKRKHTVGDTKVEPHAQACTCEDQVCGCVVVSFVCMCVCWLFVVSLFSFVLMFACCLLVVCVLLACSSDC